MQPLVLTLRGFKGIKSGLGKEEFTIDLSQYSGQIAISAPNGRGKSTILQNLHPYTIMPDRVKTYSQSSFSYYDECYLPDSKKELIFKLEDKIYKAVIEINATKKKTKAFLFVQENTDFKLIEETKDGNVEDYQRTIEKLLGSAKMFFTSVFRAQDAIKIDKYTKGELKDIFAELLCIDELKVYSDNATQVSKFLKSKKETLERDTEKLEALIRKEPEVIATKTTVADRIDTDNKNIEALKRELEDQNKRLAELMILENENKNIITKINELDTRINKRKTELEQQKTFLESKRTYYNNKYKEIKAVIENEKKVIEQEQIVKSELNETSKAEEINKKLSEDVLAIDKKIENLNNELRNISQKELHINTLRANLAKIELERKRALEKFSTLKTEKTEIASLLDRVPCKGTDYVDACLLLKNANDAKKSISEIETSISKLSVESKEENDIKKEIEVLNPIVAQKENIQKEIKTIIDSKNTIIREQQKIAPLIERHKTLIALNEKIVIAKERIPVLEKEIESILSEGKRTIGEINKVIETITQEIEQTEKEIITLKSKIDISLSKEIENSKKQIETVKREISNIETELRGLYAQKGQLEETLKQISDAKTEKEKILNKINIINQEIQEWNIVSKLYAEMIPLEIEDAGPEISEIANQLLSECFGSRFSVTIVTQEINKKGEAKEVFEIYVFDADTQEKKPLYVLSGGERVWVEEAITKAIGIYNQFKTNKKFTTLFTDERDGALDQDNKKRYFILKNKVLELGGFEREYYISHSETGTEYADYIISL